MKKIIAFLGIGLLIAGVRAETITSGSAIKHVTVFTRGAEIYRNAQVRIPAGKHEVILKGLSNNINLQSLQVAVPKNITLLSVSFKTNFITKKELAGRIASLTDSVENFRLELQLTTNKLEALRQEQELLLANKQVGGSQSGLDPDRLRQMAQYFNQRLPELKNQITKTDLTIHDMKEKLNRYQLQLNELNRNSKEPSGELVLQVIAASSTTATVDFWYIVSQAGWAPSYDIRANDISSPLMLNYKASVYQNSGIDWVEVPITISTGNPILSHNRPILNPWFLRQNTTYYFMGQDKDKASQSNLAYEKAELKSLPEKDYSGIDDYTSVNENQLNVEFEVSLPYTILSDNKPNNIALKEYSLPAEYKYHAVPKLDKNAFLLARVTDWNRLNLLPGTANIFFENKYIGQISLNPDIPQDTMLISLGRDQAIVVKREMKRDFYKKSFIGNKVKESFVYEISIRNNKNREIDIEILDQVPVSQNDEITVDLEDLSRARHVPKVGKLTWDITLTPGETRQFSVKFTVKYPEGWNIPAL